MEAQKKSYGSSLMPRSLKLSSLALNRLPRARILARQLEREGTKNRGERERAGPLPKWSRVLLNVEQDGRDVPVKHLDLTLKGEPVLWLEEWLERGFCQSVTDAVLSAFRALHERTIEQDLCEQKLRTFKSQTRGVKMYLMAEQKTGSV